MNAVKTAMRATRRPGNNAVFGLNSTTVNNRKSARTIDVTGTRIQASNSQSTSMKYERMRAAVSRLTQRMSIPNVTGRLDQLSTIIVVNET